MKRRTAAAAAALFASALAGCPVAPSTERVSVSSSEEEGDASSFGYAPAISADGRYVAFTSDATNLVPSDGNEKGDIFVRDRAAGVTERVSVGAGGVEADCVPPAACFGSDGPAISADGRYVAFTSDATNLVPGPDGNDGVDVFVRDRVDGTTEQASVATGGAKADDLAGFAAISADGLRVAFVSYADNLVADDLNDVGDAFLRDLDAGTTERVSVASDGAEADGATDGAPAISGSGLYVAFSSWATNLVPDDANGVSDVFVRDLAAGTTERVSVATGGAEADGAGDLPALSGDGRFVAFESSASNLVSDDGNGARDVFVRDRLAGTTERVSVASDGTEGDEATWAPSISRDGRYVAFATFATNLLGPGVNSQGQVLVHDRATGRTTAASVATGGSPGALGLRPSLSPDGRFVAFYSDAANLVPDDANGAFDAFLRDRGIPVP